MNIFNKLLFLPIVCIFLVISTSTVVALEKNRLVAFFQEYDTSQNKCNGKVAYAIEHGYPDIAEFLLLKNEDCTQYTTTYSIPDCPLNWHIKHPLITAIRKGYTAAAILMIQKGHWNVEEYKIQNNKFEVERKNAMWTAIEYQNPDIVLVLLASGFDVNTSAALNPPAVNSNKYMAYEAVYPTPLLQAIATKNLKIAQMLLESGAEVDKISNGHYPYNNNGLQLNFHGTPLLKAVDDNFIDGVNLLLLYGASPIKGEKYGYQISALERAIQKEYFDIVDLLYDQL